MGKKGDHGDAYDAWDEANTSRAAQQYPSHSMPPRPKWIDKVRWEMMNRIAALIPLEEIHNIRLQLDKVDLKDFTDLFSVGCGYGDLECTIASQIPFVKRTVPLRVIGIDIVRKAARIARIVAQRYYNDLFNRNKTHAFTRAVGGFWTYDVFNPAHRAKLRKSTKPDEHVRKGSVGVMILGSMLHFEKDKKQDKNQELIRIAEEWMAPGGYLVITHWLRGFGERGPADEIRPLPSDVIQWAFEAHEPLRFVNYEKLSDGLYVAIFQKPYIGDRLGKMNLKVWGLRGKGKNRSLFESQVEVSVKRKQAQAYRKILGQLEHIKWEKEEENAAYKNYAKASVFLDGLVMRLIKDNPTFVKDIQQLVIKEPDYRKLINNGVDVLMQEMRNNRNFQLSLLERGPYKFNEVKAWNKNYNAQEADAIIETYLKGEEEKLRRPEEFEARRILMGWLDLVFNMPGSHDKLRSAAKWLAPYKLPDNHQQFKWRYDEGTPKAEILPSQFSPSLVKVSKPRQELIGAFSTSPKTAWHKIAERVKERHEEQLREQELKGLVTEIQQEMKAEAAKEEKEKLKIKKRQARIAFIKRLKKIRRQKKWAEAASRMEIDPDQRRLSDMGRSYLRIQSERRERNGKDRHDDENDQENLD